MEEFRKIRSFKNCAKEKKKEGGSPSYENERSLYKKEISLKIEEFKLARSNWVASKKEEEIKTNSKEGLNESGANKGRFNAQRKIGLSTGRLRKHYQTVKPLRYFTLEPNISDTDTSKSKQEKQWNQQLIEQDSFEEGTMLREKQQQIWDDKETEIKELVDEALGRKVTEKEEKKKKRKGPSKKAIENLKASKHDNRFFETCKCSDGKEVTVVIKGFCLCDKGNLKTFKLNKINDNIKKLEKFKSEFEKEEVEPHSVDSLELHRKQIERKSAMINKKEKEEEEEEEEEKKQDRMVQRSKSEKSVSFGASKIDRGIDNEWKSEKNEKKGDQEIERGTEEYEKAQKKRREEEEEIERKLKKEQEEMRKEQEEIRREREEIRKEREERKKEQEELRKEVEEKRKEQKEKRVQEGERSSEKKEAEAKKLKEKKEKFLNTADDVTSIITLFQNVSPIKSNMALTREEFEKMQKISE